jgi:hypothetical protein
LKDKHIGDVASRRAGSVGIVEFFVKQHGALHFESFTEAAHRP